ncbi:hypothetical protein POM88_022869 [Heracleum sosnowskyi]|uniref:Uncharacterized protein n=1 Tax=Heracleum sosnowskyi TaxID=360622 RepID=A0AAD8IFZ9_9APIA|nr:hypothetical protein POM88_022869 [Heracleum sosnowskyi]
MRDIGMHGKFYVLLFSVIFFYAKSIFFQTFLSYDEWCFAPLKRMVFCPIPPGLIYHVEVNADSCIVEECLELLKRIACDDRFITCSVESARLFYADLNEDEAVKLKGLNEIHSVYPRSSLMVDL